MAMNKANCTLSGSGDSGGEFGLDSGTVIGGGVVGDAVSDSVISGTSAGTARRCRNLLGIHTRWKGWCDRVGVDGLVPSSDEEAPSAFSATAANGYRIAPCL